MGLIEGFSARYGLTRLVCYETFAMVVVAIQSEKTIKHWPRQWKINLVENLNPAWRDLDDELL